MFPMEFDHRIHATAFACRRAIALSPASHILGWKIRRDVAMTGEIDTQGRISSIGALVRQTGNGLPSNN